MAYLPILTYHRLLPRAPTRDADPQRIAVSQSQFRGHLRWLKSLGYETLPLAGYVRALRAGEKVPARRLAITFDDGYRDVLTLGLPVLKEFGFTATIFAVSAEERNAWDHGNAPLMNAQELRDWQAAGMEVGAHTSHHVHLPQVSPDIARKEIQDSKARLEDLLGKAVSTLAYPYGESTPAVEALAENAGFAAAFATDRAPRDHSENLYRLRRAVVFPRNNVWEIFLKAQRWYPAYQDWKRP
jgi:peptidoglycan/xylan/chitin deacetylase (PgdA/CDA1 family)